MLRLSTTVLTVFFLLSCTLPQSENNGTRTKSLPEESLINESGTTIETRFRTPEFFKRTEVEGNSFAQYLRTLPLKPHDSLVKYYDGRTKPSNYVYCAVVDMEISKRDLQQCADAVMRLRGEYLFHSKQYDKIHFNFTNGFRVDYSKWMQGQRVSIKGNSTKWVSSASPSNTYKDFRNYMELVFAYAGTLSLSKELKPVELEDMQIGDVFILGGSPGHAVIVVDMAVSTQTGEKLFLLAQSYMPAQETQILLNPNNGNLGPWYSLGFAGDLRTPEWTFAKNSLMRFSDE